MDIWNSLPGETQVRKFKDRATAVSRIWKAIQNLNQAAPVTEENPVPETAAVSEPEASETTQAERVSAETVATPVAPQSPDVTPEGAPARNKATRATKAPKPATNASPRENSKTSQVIAMLKREGGATLEEIMTAMGWQKHTTRSMLSAGGSLTKNHGLVIVSEKIGEKRTYSIKA